MNDHHWTGNTFKITNLSKIKFFCQPEFFHRSRAWVLRLKGHHLQSWKRRGLDGQALQKGAGVLFINTTFWVSEVFSLWKAAGEFLAGRAQRLLLSYERSPAEDVLVAENMEPGRQKQCSLTHKSFFKNKLQRTHKKKKKASEQILYVACKVKSLKR